MATNWDRVEKACSKCDEVKPLEEYHKRGDRPDGRQNTCKKCQYARYLERLAEDPAKVRAIGAASQARHRRRRMYGITNAQYDAMVLERGGRCDSCARMPERALQVDHDHACCPGSTTCGACVRGLLCSNCNSIAGYANDSVEVLESVVAYLRHSLRA